MRLPCPHCGLRDRREFTYIAAAEMLERPGGDWSEAWHARLHLRENPAGTAREIWCHEPCGACAVVSRDRTSHAVTGAEAPR